MGSELCSGVPYGGGMTLGPAQQDEARRDLAALVTRSGLGAREVARDLGFRPRRARAALVIAPGADPADVWAVRDYLARAIRDRGLEPVDCRVLSDANRIKAQRWFVLGDPPAVGADEGPA